jgi:hypothetical protein
VKRIRKFSFSSFLSPGRFGALIKLGRFISYSICILFIVSAQFRLFINPREMPCFLFTEAF